MICCRILCVAGIVAFGDAGLYDSFVRWYSIRVQPRPLPALLHETFVMLQERQLVTGLVLQLLGCLKSSTTPSRVFKVLAEPRVSGLPVRGRLSVCTTLKSIRCWSASFDRFHASENDERVIRILSCAPL